MGVTLAQFIERLAGPRRALDRDFARELAAGLDAEAAHVELPAIEALGLRDVLVTFSMDEALRLVITGTHPDGHGEVTLRYRDRDLNVVDVELREQERATPYSFCTLDYSVRGARCELLQAAPPLPAGQEVTARALATLGARAELRVRGLGVDVSVPPEGVRWLRGT